MDPAAIYAKTDKGAEEIRARTYKLPLKSRTLLIMIDGKSPASEVIDKGKASGNSAAFATLEELEAQGFISLVRGAAPSAIESIEPLRRFGIDQVLAILGPGADDFTSGLEDAADLQALMVQLERCRETVSAVAGAQKGVRFWAGVQERLPASAAPPKPQPQRAPPVPSPSKIHPDPTRRMTLPSVRRYAVDYMNALPGPHGRAFAERIEYSADRGTLVAILERCRTAVQLAAGDEEAERFWTGVQQRLPPG
jgi:hypothetical protein